MVIATTDNTENPQQWGFDAQLGKVLLNLVATERKPTEISRGSSQAETINTSENPNDFVDAVGRTFSQVEFTGGEGLHFAHRRQNPENAETLFSYSHGLKVNDNGNIEVVNQTEQISAGSGPDPVARASYDGTDLYVTNGTADLTKWTNLSGTPSSSSEVTGASNNLEDTTNLGDVIYVCDGTEVRSNQGTGTWANVSNQNATRLWPAKGRLFAAVGNELYEGLEGGAGNLLVTLDSGETWLDVKDVGPFILAVASNGLLYSFTFDGSTVSLKNQTQFNDEDIYAIASVYNRILVLTHQHTQSTNAVQRLWTATVTTEGVLDDLDVIREWDNVPHTSHIRYLKAIGRSDVLLAVDDLTLDGTDSIQLYRYDAAFNSIMSDLIFDGLTDTYATFIKLIEGEAWLVTANGDIWRETVGTKRAQGIFLGPMVDFFTVEEKVWNLITLDGKYPDDNDAIRASISSDTDALDNPTTETFWTEVKTFRDPTNTRIALNLRASRFLGLRCKIQGNAVLKSYALRSLPPVSDEEIILTVNVSDDTNRRGKRMFRIVDHGIDLWQRVRELQGQSLILEIYDLNSKWRGAILEVNTPLAKTDIQRGSKTKTFDLLFRGEKLADVVINDNVWGFQQWGEGTWGHTDLSNV